MNRDEDEIFIQSIQVGDDRDFQGLESTIATLLKCHRNRCAFLMTEKFLEVKILVLKCLKKKMNIKESLEGVLFFLYEQQKFIFSLQEGLQLRLGQREGGDTITVDLYWINPTQ